MTDHLDICRAVAGYGLSGGAATLPDRELDNATWRAVLEHVTEQRVTAHLVRALDDGAFAANGRQRDMAIERLEQALSLDLMLERLLLDSVDTLDAAAIPVRVLKGPVLAQTVYPSPAFRSFGDIDLLVSASRYDDAVELLCSGGARRRYAEPRSGFDRRFGKGVCIETERGLEIDLHRTFVAGPFGLAVDTQELFASRDTFHLADRVLDCLGVEERFVHACFHASLGSPEPRLVPLRDVAQILLSAEVALDRVRDLCTRWRCGIVVQHATQTTWDTFALTADHEVVEWAGRYRPSRFEARAFEAYVGPRRSYPRQAVAGLQAVRGLRAKFVYAAALLAPDSSYVRERDGSYLRRFGRGVRLLIEERTGH